MLIKKINSFKDTKKNFLSNNEINKIMNEVYSQINKKINLKSKNISFLRSRKEFDKRYFKLKKNKQKWTQVYQNSLKLKFHKKILEPKIKSYLKQRIKDKFTVINSQLRIIEKSDKRSYPLHQELIKGKKKLIVFWIALNKIKKNEGGLIVYKTKINNELKHIYNEMKYPILPNQKNIKNNCIVKSFDPGEALILGQYIPHGTAPKLKGPPRWAAIIRISIG